MLNNNNTDILNKLMQRNYTRFKLSSWTSLLKIRIS